MRVPQTFVSENAELNLDRIMAKKVYYIPKRWKSIEVRMVNGDFVDSKIIDGSRITDQYLAESRKFDGRVMDLKTFKFNGKDMFISKFGDSMHNLVLFDDKLNEILFTQSCPNPSYCVFERKNNPDALVLNITGSRSNGTIIGCYDNKGNEIAAFGASIDHESGYGKDTLTSTVSAVKTKKQNYLALEYFSHIQVRDEDLNFVSLLRMSHKNSKKISVANIGGIERIICLGVEQKAKSCLYSNVVNIFDNSFSLVEQIYAETLGCKCIFRCESFKLDGKEYFIFAYENEKGDADVKILDTDFKEVLKVKDVNDFWHVRAGKFNGQDYMFIPSGKRSKAKVQVYDNNFRLRDSIKVSNCALNRKYYILSINSTDYFTCVQEGNLNFYSGEFPLQGGFFKKKKPLSIKLKNDTEDRWLYSLKEIIPFEYKDENFLALEYWTNECTDVYDNNLKLVKSFPGGDFCVV
ncbi:hypothetical protein FJZ53_02630 [Candidatus Woesearchaeota archaeon]|nr:hypothetical protein [Candidatus Woesearchaeota archaeon]